MPQKTPIAPVSRPLPPKRSKVLVGEVPRDPRATVLQGTTPWQVDGDTNITTSVLPSGAASEATLQELSAEVRTLQVLDEINETLKQMKFLLQGIAGV